MKKKPKYSFFQSLGYMLKKASACHGSVPYLCLGIALTSAGIYVLELFISPAILGKIENGSPLYSLLLTLGLFIAGLYALNWLMGYFEKQAWFLYYAVRSEIADDIRFKALTTSYPNTVSPEAVRLRNLSHEATAGESRGTEQVWRKLSDLVSNVICFFVYLVLLTKLHWLMILLVLATSAAVFFINNRIHSWSRVHKDEEAKYWTEQCYIREKCESPQTAKDIHIFDLKSWLRKAYQKSLFKGEDFIERREKHFFKAKLSDIIAALLRNTAAYVYLIWLALETNMSAAEFLLYFTAVTGFAKWITEILSKTIELRQCGHDISNVLEYLNLSEPFDLTSGEKIPPASGYELKLENVSFTYPGSDTPVIADFDLTIRPGEKLAVVGLNGAGKTTLVRLLCGFYDPDRGRVLLNGKDIRTFNRREYYKLFSAVFQDYSVLDISLGENVSQKTDCKDKDRIYGVLDKAGLSETVANLSSGLETKVGRNVFLDGVSFSGGQIQKLIFARALYKNGPILILDEPTAALDPIAENDIYTKYHDMTKGKTSLFISHRLASTRFCDRIIYLTDGKIAEEGTHEELLSANGRYAELFAVQSKYYKEDARQ